MSHGSPPPRSGKTRFGPSRPDVNRYLKWAFVEAANAICLNRGRAPRRHVTPLYERAARRKGHQKAIGGSSTFDCDIPETTIMPLHDGEDMAPTTRVDAARMRSRQETPTSRF
jgi:hypothetical protein